MVEKNTFLLTTARGAEDSGGSELYMLLTEFGDSKSKITRTGVSGVLLVETELAHQEVIEMLKKMMEFEPWRARSMLRLIPLEKIVDIDLEIIKEAVKPLMEKIGPEESFRITVEKRHSDLSRAELIEAVASTTSRKVDLENPDWVVLVEVIRDTVGLSVVRPSQIISIVKVKRGDAPT
jgi:tRNA acetyltransferase TAN1